MTAFWLIRACLLLAVGTLFVEILARLVTRGKIRAASACRLSYLILAAAMVLPFLSTPSSLRPKPSLQVWAAPTMRLHDIAAAPVVTVAASSTPAPLSDLRWVLVLWAIAACLRGLWVLFDLTRLVRHLNRSFVIRSVGPVRVVVSSIFAVPFSLRTAGRRWVVLPDGSAEDPAGMRTALHHEFQHHRQGDTFWSWWLEALRIAFVPHPAAWILSKRLTEFQELACDHALIGRGAVGPQAYGRCLLRAAQTALSTRGLPACAAGMASSRQGAFLQRRITMLFEYKEKPRSPWFGLLLALFAVCTLAGAAVASSDWVRDRRITMEQAKQWVGKRSAFPTPLNARVLKQLNRYLGTPDGREFLRNAMQRKEAYDSVLEAKLAEYNVPKELYAVALMESGFHNAQASANPVGAAGVWQFMAQTARNYNLRVDSQVDERLNVPKETDAAFRLLKALHLQFQDWGLALLGYNAGENFVLRAIQNAGTRDVWKLIDAGYVGDNEYVEKVIAGAIILNNPSVLD